MLVTLANPDVLDDGEPMTSALDSGIGTREVENGVAPDETGTFGFETFWLRVVAFEPNCVRNEPEKRRLPASTVGVMA